MTNNPPMTPTPPPAPVDQSADATAELTHYADKYRDTPITEQFTLLLIYTKQLAAETGSTSLTNSEIAWLRRSVEHYLEDSMTTTDDPRPAATEAAMIDQMTDEYLVQRLFDIANAAGVWHGMGLHQFEQGQQAESLDNYNKGKGLVADAAPVRAELMRRLARAESAPGVTLTATLATGALYLPECQCGAELRCMGPHEVRCDSCGAYYRIVVTLPLAGYHTVKNAALADAGTGAGK